MESCACGRGSLLFRHQIDVMNHAGVVHLAVTLAVRDFLPQIRQRNVGTVAFNQCPLLLSLLGVKRTCHFAPHMSAFDPKRTWGKLFWVRASSAHRLELPLGAISTAIGLGCNP